MAAMFQRILMLRRPIFASLNPVSLMMIAVALAA
jgi:hypothetical protein